MNVVLASFSLPKPHGNRRVGFAVNGSQRISYRGYSLPRGYFCSVTPP